MSAWLLPVAAAIRRASEEKALDAVNLASKIEEAFQCIYDGAGGGGVDRIYAGDGGDGGVDSDAEDDEHRHWIEQRRELQFVQVVCETCRWLAAAAESLPFADHSGSGGGGPASALAPPPPPPPLVVRSWELGRLDVRTELAREVARLGEGQAVQLTVVGGVAVATAVGVAFRLGHVHRNVCGFAAHMTDIDTRTATAAPGATATAGTACGGGGGGAGGGAAAELLESVRALGPLFIQPEELLPEAATAAAAGLAVPQQVPGPLAEHVIGLLAAQLGARGCAVLARADPWDGDSTEALLVLLARARARLRGLGRELVAVPLRRRGEKQAGSDGPDGGGGGGGGGGTAARESRRRQRRQAAAESDEWQGINEAVEEYLHNMLEEAEEPEPKPKAVTVTAAAAGAQGGAAAAASAAEEDASSPSPSSASAARAAEARHSGGGGGGGGEVEPGAPGAPVGVPCAADVPATWRGQPASAMCVTRDWRLRCRHLVAKLVGGWLGLRGSDVVVFMSGGLAAGGSGGGEGRDGQGQGEGGGRSEEEEDEEEEEKEERGARLYNPYHELDPELYMRDMVFLVMETPGDPRVGGTHARPPAAPPATRADPQPPIQAR
ncbi:hypothetical protein GPECTOR_4g770 [Gonium pectorale]|uniref:Uncharacterized protein n=1 Tax=Gonium pectorale TaxID=33097 RepID=A0A150GYB7_GONPE|nr:hypothetical protein GPECTOR_4g770 [Gonium pectorale]|eukprot:KXZ54702.1 hypothetical protein GPECTOR_4g770 [Gonium pectorale]